VQGVAGAGRLQREGEFVIDNLLGEGGKALASHRAPEPRRIFPIAPSLTQRPHPVSLSRAGTAVQGVTGAGRVHLLLAFL
jgi:hypothetical protein